VNDQPRHPGIAAALASGAEGRVAYLAQEYVTGEALDASLRQYGPPALDAALVTLGWMAEALDRAAGEGIHHGCLHPRDVIVSPNGDARVIDLGVAEALQRAGLRAPVRRPYSAPERVDGRSWGGPADIFALGAIAYELVTGRRVPGPGVPVLSNEGMSGLDQPALAEILGRALAADPAARFASASDLVDVVRPVLAKARRVTLARRRKSLPEGVVPLPLDHLHEIPEASDAEEPEGEVTVAEPELPVAPAPQHHDPADLPLTIAPAPAAAAPAADRAVRRPRPITPAIEPEPVSPASAAVLQSPTWRNDTPDAVSRWSLASMLVALVVGLSGGFGLGYWFAWRSALREHPALTTQATQEAPASARVEEPVARPEPSTPAPAPVAAPPAATRPQAPAPAATTPPEPAPAPTAERSRGKRESGPPGKLLIRSTPSGARVSINGRARGRTPLILRDMPLRVLTVTVSQSGYKPNEQRVALSAARPTATVEAKLVAEGGETAAGVITGSLFIESRPSAAKVFVDNRSFGTTPVSVPELSPGYHRVRLELGGFASWVTMAEVKVGARTRVSASLEQQ
jgi:serine/threonine-protein kinase